MEKVFAMGVLLCDYLFDFLLFRFCFFLAAILVGGGIFARWANLVGRPELIDDPRFRTNADRLNNVAALDEVIAGATGRLDALLYIVADDDSGRRFVQQLAQKAASGVAVPAGSMQKSQPSENPCLGLTLVSRMPGKIDPGAPLFQNRICQ